MKDFLPFKSYRLLDAAWVMCCGPMAGGERRPGSQNTPVPMLSQQLTQMLRGPEEQEYELKLSSRMENSQVMVRFTLLGSVTASETISDAAQMRQMARKIADLKDQASAPGENDPGHEDEGRRWYRRPATTSRRWKWICAGRIARSRR